MFNFTKHLYFLSSHDSDVGLFYLLGNPGSAIFRWLYFLFLLIAAWLCHMPNRSGSTMAQVMACCKTAPSHHLNQCSLIIIHLFSIQLMVISQKVISPRYEFENSNFKNTAVSIRVQGAQAGFYTKGCPLVKSNLICLSDKLNWISCILWIYIVGC